MGFSSAFPPPSPPYSQHVCRALECVLLGDLTDSPWSLSQAPPGQLKILPWRSQGLTCGDCRCLSSLHRLNSSNVAEVPGPGSATSLSGFKSQTFRQLALPLNHVLFLIGCVDDGFKPPRTLTAGSFWDIISDSPSGMSLGFLCGFWKPDFADLVRKY